ncbi:MAG: molybdenum cofactor biosynthesis protein MoaE [Rhodothermales bacterium]
MEELRTDRRWIRIQEAPLDVAPASDFLRVEEAGGIDLFLGTTRRWTDGRETVQLEYECYESMAVSELDRLLDEAADRWPLSRACILHRTGAVPLREISVVVGVSTPHRDAAFGACRYLIDELKRRVPIWKKERFADGTTDWVEGERPPLTDG